MTYKKQRNTDEDSTKNILAAHRELDQYSEKNYEEDKILQRWWLHWQQINEVEKDKEGASCK